MKPHELAQSLAKPSSCLSSQEMRWCHKLCEMSKDMMRERFCAVVRRNLDRPAMLSYSSDSTPLQTTQTIKSDFWDIRIIRRGRQGNSFVIQRLWFVSQMDRSVMFTEPLKLADGTAMTHYQCYKDLFPTLLQSGHRSISINHSCVDRGLASLQPLLHQHHLMTEADLAASLPEWERTRRRLCTWHVETQCSCHDAHKAMEWSLQPFLANRDILKNCFAIIASLRNSYHQIANHLSGWISGVLSYADWEYEPYGLWVMLGVDAGIMELMVSLELRWDEDSGRLLVAERWRNNPDTALVVRTAIMGVMKYKKWSESRWVTIGTNCRAVVASLLLGMPSLIHYIRTRPKESDYYISGAGEKLNNEERRFLVNAALLSHLSDTVLCSLLEDGRLALMRSSVESEILAEMQWADGLGDATVGLLAGVANMSALDLRTDLMTGILTSASFLHHRLRPARSVPWTLCGSGKSEKLNQFAAGPRPECGVGQQIHDLLSIGFPEATIIEALTVLENIDWSVTPAEQGHRHASAIARAHPGYCRDTLQARSQLGQLVTLWPKDETASKEAALLRKLHQLEKRRPVNYQGRQEFCKGLLELMKKKRAAGLISNPHVGKQVMATHHTHWNSLPKERKELWEKQAEESRAKKARLNDAEKQRCRAELLALRHQRSSEALAESAGPPCRLTECRFSDAEVQSFDSRWDDPRYTRGQIRERRALVAQPVGPPDAGLQARLAAFRQEPADRLVAPRAWMRSVAMHRSEFTSAIFRVEFLGNDVKLFRFIFARQSPQVLIAFMPVKQVASFSKVSLGRVASPIGKPWAAQFEFDIEDYPVLSDEIEWPQQSAVQVVMQVYYLRCGRLVSDDGLRPLGDVLNGLPQDDSKLDAPPTRGPQGGSRAALLQEFPWMQDFIQHSSSGGKASSRVGGGAPHDMGAPSDDDVQAADVDAIFEELYRRRAEAEVEAGEQADAPFSWSVLGGRWTAEHRGVACDAYSCKASSAAARDFIAKFGMQKTFRVSIQQYGELVCSALCRAWVHKMTWLYRMWEESAFSPDFQFLSADVRSYEEPAEVAGIFEGGGQAVRGRIAQIRSIGPSGMLP